MTGMVGGIRSQKVFYAILGLWICSENYGMSLDGFKLGSKLFRFVFQKDYCKDCKGGLEEEAIYLILKNTL